MTAVAYTPAWQATRRWTHRWSTACLDAAFDSLGAPLSLLDVGCGEGHLVMHAAKRGVPAIGVDVTIDRHIDMTPTLLAKLGPHDLTTPLDLMRTFDWVLCWEVAEHLPASAADTLCDTLRRHMRRGSRLLFTAAPPGQGGYGHVNEQPHTYWLERFHARGLGYDPDVTHALRAQWLKKAPKTPWYGRNLLAMVCHA